MEDVKTNKDIELLFSKIWRIFKGYERFSIQIWNNRAVIVGHNSVAYERDEETELSTVCDFLKR